MIAPALRLVAAVASGAVLVGRPRSGVLHVYAGPLTPSDRFVPRSGRTVCRVRTRRLMVIEAASERLDLRGRRVCRRCTPLLPASLGRVDAAELGAAREQWLAAYGHLSPADVRQAAACCRTVAETHQVGRVATMLHGEKPRGLTTQLAPARAAVREMHDALETRRRHLAAAERTQDERDQVARLRAMDEHERQRVETRRRNETARDRALDRLRRGQYLAPWERQLVS